MPLVQPSTWPASQASVVGVAQATPGELGGLPAGAPPGAGAAAGGAALPGAGVAALPGGADGAALPTTAPGAADCTGSRPSSGFFFEHAARPTNNAITASLFTHLS
jgi:hypothetical protein